VLILVSLGRQPLESSLTFPSSRKLLLPARVVLIVFGSFQFRVSARQCGNLNAASMGRPSSRWMMRPVARRFALGRRQFRSFADYLLKSTTSPEPATLCVLAATMIGAGIGFLWFNAPTASILMGDTGFARARRHAGPNRPCKQARIVLGHCRGLFVVEAVFGIVQVVSSRSRQARIQDGAADIITSSKRAGTERIVIASGIISVVSRASGLSTPETR